MITKPHGRTHIGSIFLFGIFSDGPGLILSPTKNGGIVVVRIPPREPVMSEITAVESVMVHEKTTAAQISEHFKIPESSAQLVVDSISALKEQTVSS
jgi:hypothetical protein